MKLCLKLGKPRVFHSVLASALCLGVLALPSQAATWYVQNSGSGSDTTGTGSSTQPWFSISKAVASNSPVQPGDTIIVRTGWYVESLELGKSGTSSARITLKNEGDVYLNDPTPTSGWWQTGVLMANGKSNWNIEGFKVQNSSWGGITLRSCSNITVQRCHTYRTGSSGIIALPNNVSTEGEAEVQSSNIKVLDCIVEEANYYEGNASYTANSGDQEALTIWGVNGFEVARCRVFNGRTEGIDVKTGSRNGTVHHNEVYGCAAVTGLQWNTGLDRRSGGPGIYIDGGRANVFNVQVFNNKVRDNKAEGIAVADEDSRGSIYDIRVYNNVTYGNGIQGVNSGAGINIASGSNVDVFMNTSVGDVSGFTVTGGGFGTAYPQNLEVRNNIFANAKYQTIYLQNSNGTIIDRNLWTTTPANPVNNAGGNTNLSVTSSNIATSNPGLTSTWRILSTSPARNAATWTGANGMTLVAGTDIDDQTRSTPDIGADEWVSGAGVASVRQY